MDEENLRESSATEPALEQMLMEILQAANTTEENLQNTKMKQIREQLQEDTYRYLP